MEGIPKMNEDSNPRREPHEERGTGGPCPVTFRQVMKIEDLKDRARTAREHGFPSPYLLRASTGNNAEALINRIIAEADLSSAMESHTPQEKRPKPTDNGTGYDLSRLKI